MQYDTKKNRQNIAKHGISFEEAEYFEWRDAVTLDDSRFNYGEERYISYGNIGHRLHVLVWTQRHGEKRIISLRKANSKEKEYYEEEKNST